MIPVNEPLLDGNEKKYLIECIDTGWISSEGPFVRQFEEKFAHKVARKHAIAVCNGSVALDVAVAALDIGSGDEVIVPTFTIISCVAAIVRAGATPVLVDSNPMNWNMDIEQIEAKITARTRAIMVVHIYGLPVDITAVELLARKYHLKIIEDSAEQFGQSCNGQPCGSFGDISTFSFYPNKHTTTGEGGMVVTNDDAVADRCRRFRNLCFQEGRRFVHEELGWNFRMTNLQAALGVAQLERIDEFVLRKRNIGEIYNSGFNLLANVQRPLEKTSFATNIYWVYGMVLDDSVSFDATEAMHRLGKKGVATRPFFWPMHEQPIFHKMGLFRDEQYPVAERIARRGFYIPSGLALTKEQQHIVIREVKELLS